MTKKYRRLRHLMMEMDVDQAWVAKTISRSTMYVSQRLRGLGDWTMGEMYAIGKLLRIPKEELITYFPEGGNDDLPSLRDGSGAITLPRKEQIS